MNATDTTYQFDFLGTYKTLDESLKANSFFPGATCKGDIHDIRNTLVTLRSALRTLEIPPEENFYVVLRVGKSGKGWNLQSDPMTFPEIDEALQAGWWGIDESAFDPLFIEDDCVIDHLTVDECNRLTSVGGDLDLYVGCPMVLPNLVSVEGNLCARDTTDLTLPKLTGINGDLDAVCSANLSMPSLHSVGGDLDAEGATDLTLPMLSKVDGDLDVLFSENLTIPMALALEKNVPVGCLSVATLKQAAQAEQEAKNKRIKQNL